MWSTVELREIRVFLTLAEELHFGRAAERLQLTPSRVSQSLRALEAKLGAELVHRTSRRVELTTAGERFLDQVQAAHAHLMGVLERTHEESRGFAGTLRVGLLTAVVEGPDLPAITRAFEERHPECPVEVAKAPFGDAIGCLRRGEIDLLVTWLPHGQPDLVVGPTLARARRVLAVGPGHPLGQRAEVSLEEIADYRVVPMEQVMPKALADAWIPRTTPGGRPIRRLRIPFGEMARRDPGGLRQQMSWWIRTGDIVHPTVAPVEALLGPGITYVPIADMPPLTSALVWRRGASDLRVREFVRVAEEVLQAKRDGMDARVRAL